VGCGVASILVVNDEPGIRRLLRITLGPDHRVDEAAGGAEALRMLRAAPPDLAIIDVGMPEMDSLAVCRAAEPACCGASHLPMRTPCG
jgi:CheY-like chemotaxis protein